MYKVKRLIKAGEFNDNGIKFEETSLKKALDEYIKKFGNILVPFRDPNNLRERTEMLPDDIVGKVDRYDDEYVYISNLYMEHYKKILESEDIKCQIVVVSSSDFVDVGENKRIYNIIKVLQIRFV